MIDQSELSIQQSHVIRIVYVLLNWQIIPKGEMRKGWPKALSHPISVCSLCLSILPCLYVFPLLFSIIHTLVLTHACSKPPDILSTDTTPSLSGCSLAILPHIAVSLLPILRPQTPQLSSDLHREAGDKQQELVKQQEHPNYVFFNQQWTTFKPNFISVSRLPFC